MKIFTTLGKTAKFLETVGNLFKAFSVHEKKGEYELQSLESVFVLIDESFKTLKLFETNVRNHLQKPRKLHKKDSYLYFLLLCRACNSLMAQLWEY